MSRLHLSHLSDVVVKFKREDSPIQTYVFHHLNRARNKGGAMTCMYEVFEVLEGILEETSKRDFADKE
jgi:hypothetical protein